MLEFLPEWYAEYVQPDGSMYVEIVKALYGLPESSVRWYMNISKFLQSLNYIPSEYDKCLFYNKRRASDESNETLLCDMIIVYVDDIFYPFSTIDEEQNFLDKMRKEYGEFLTVASRSKQTPTMEIFKYLCQIILKISYKSIILIEVL